MGAARSIAHRVRSYNHDTYVHDTTVFMTDTPDHDRTSAPEYMRRIRSFVLREGRMTPAQQRAFDEHWARYGIDYRGDGTAHDFAASFGRQAPLVLEIGFGNGEALAWASEHDQARDFIGVEVHGPGVGRLMNVLAAREANNVRLYRHDAVEVLQHEVAPGTLAEARIWFPDPWHKKRHNKRRLIQPEFVALLASRMAPNGLLHLATDWQAYAEHMLEVMEAAPGWRNQLGPGQYAEKPEWRIETHFERRGLKLGHGVWDLLYRKS
jgi:tRNA (guanine-N7-)-methyltransferase